MSSNMKWDFFVPIMVGVSIMLVLWVLGGSIF